jgi:hypothetical protein
MMNRLGLAMQVAWWGHLHLLFGGQFMRIAIIGLEDALRNFNTRSA